MSKAHADALIAKKKKQTTKAVASKPQSSSVSKASKVAKNSTFMGGGASTRKTEATVKTKQPSAKAQRVAATAREQQAQKISKTTTAAQRQKMQMQTAEDLRKAKQSRQNVSKAVKSSVKQSMSEDNRSFMQRQKSGTMTTADQRRVEQQSKRRTEIAKNTGAAAKKGVQDTLTGYGKTMADLSEMTASTDRMTYGQAAKLGIDKKDTAQWNKLEANRKKGYEQSKETLKKLGEKQDARQAAWDKRTKNAKGLEKAWYGAVESGTGMLTDMAVGAVTGTGQIGSLASMGFRTYGTTRGQAQKEGATENEDRLYSLLQAGKEVGTELMFQGAGLAKSAYTGGKAGLSVADRVANALTKGITGRRADLVGAGVRLLGGTAEENVEELAGWGLDPLIKEFTYGKNVRTRQAKDVLKQESDALRAQIQSTGDAQSVAAYLSSDRFIEQNVEQYKEAGLSDKQAREVAEQMREYLTASLSGDTDRMAELEDSITSSIAGGSIKAALREYDLGELKDTFASTSLLTLATGLPASATTTMKGAQIRDNLGSDGIRALAETAIDFEDGEASLKAQVARDRIDSGKELTSTQVYDLAQAQAQQIEKDAKRVYAAAATADNAIQDANYVTPVLGNDEIITMNYTNESNDAAEIISNIMKEEGSESLTDTEVENGSRAIAGFKTGAFTVNDANALNYTNTTVRTAFEQATGIDLSQYTVKNRDGSINIPETNAATKDALFAMAADNFIKTAEAETNNWMDSVKGQVVTEVSARMGAQGSLAVQQALDDVDERDRSTYMMHANAADMMYQAARNMGTEWETVKSEATRMFPGVSEQKLEAMYNAGLRDRADAANGAIGQQVKIGETMALNNEPAEPKGKVFVDTEATPKGTVVRVFSEIASNLGVDIHLVDDLRAADGRQVNGMYSEKTGVIYINMNSDFESNIGYIFMHEVTHHLKLYAPEQFNELENLVREKWFGYNPEQMQNEIAKKLELYRTVDPDITEEQALEEIIADAAHEFINDPNFAEQVAEQNPSIAKAILNGIRNALRMLRRMFALGSIDDETHMNTLFSQLGILDEAEKLWLNAYTQAVRNKAAVGLIEWQEKANSQNSGTEEGRYSLTPVEPVQPSNNAWKSGANFAEVKAAHPTLFEQDTDQSEQSEENDKRHLTQVKNTVSTYNKIYDILGRDFKGTILDASSGLGEGTRSGRENYGFDVDDIEPYPAADYKPRYMDYSALDKQYDVVISNAVLNVLTQDDRDAMVNHIGELLKPGGRAFINVRGSDVLNAKNKIAIDESNMEYFIPKTTKSGYYQKGFTPKELKAYLEDALGEGFTVQNSTKFGKSAAIVTKNEGTARFSITPQQDADYMKAVESGDMETAQRMVDEAAARSMPNTKLTGRWYHGTENEFTEFNFSQGGKNGHADGYGIYLTNDPEVTKPYGSRMIEGYVNVERPASAFDRTLSDIELHRLIERTVDVEAETLQYEGYDSLKKAKFDTWISNYTDTYYAGSIDKAIDEVVDSITQFNGNDYDIILEIMTGMGIRDYDAASDFYDILTEETGIDGFETKWGDESEMADPNTPTIALAFRSEQIKDASPVTYDDNGNVIPLSERFNTENKDIRYSISTTADYKIGETLGDEPVGVFAESGEGNGINVRYSIPTEINAHIKGDGRVTTVRLMRDGFMKGRGKERKAVNAFIDALGDHMVKSNDLYKYISLSDVQNATVTYRKDADGNPTSVIMSCQVQNGEYEINYDFSTICKKRKAFQDLIETFFRKTDMDTLDLTEENIFKINQVLESYGFEIACPICFVEARRYANQEYADKIVSTWNAEVEKINPDAEYFDFANSDPSTFDYVAIDEALKKVKITEGMDFADKCRELVKSGAVFQKKMQQSDVLTNNGIIGMKAMSNEDKNLFGYMKGSRGASAPKEIVSFNAYNGEIEALKETYNGMDLDKFLYTIGGARLQSFSDFQIENVYDYIQLIAGFAARKLPAHAYTKEVAFAKLFGMTGMKINLSLVCDVDPNVDDEHAGLKKDENGEWVYNLGSQSFDIEAARELQADKRYSKNVGTIMVGLSDAHIWMALDDPDVRYVIPYHKSGLPNVIQAVTHLAKAEDYTKYQNTCMLSATGIKKLQAAGYETDIKAIYEKNGKNVKKTLAEINKNLQAVNFTSNDVRKASKLVPKQGSKTGEMVEKKLSSTGDFNVYDDVAQTKNPRKTAENYCAYCFENGYMPLFFEFAGHKNYYKMIFDFNVYDSVSERYAPQGAVKNIYPGCDLTKGEADYSGLFNENGWQEGEENGLIDEYLHERDKFHKEQDPKIKDVITEVKENILTDLTLRDDEEEVRWSLSDDAKDMDALYMDAVNSGNMEEAQKYVNEAAERAGYNIQAYHGTPNYGFTEFQDVGVNNGRTFGDGFYFTDVKDASKRFALQRWKKDETSGEYVEDGTPGIYNVFLNTADDALEFDWNNYTYNGRKLSGRNALHFIQWDIEEQPYKDVIVHNINDGSQNTSTVYVIKDAGRIKSADAVTYAEDGSVIPLSQRFDPNNNDIRYSLPTQDSDGTILTDGQMEYFKNSQARDELGRLVPVYHVTPMGGFTIFDPSYSFDETSISFSNDLDFALNYSSDDGNPDDWRTAAETRLGDTEIEDDQLGHYKVYLNMQNPLILEGDYLDEMDMYEWPVYAKANGYDGVIYRDFEDDGSDIYHVFSSSQIKDTRNENPSENPDIRYSIPPEDEAMSHMAADYAYDNSYEALANYESMLDDYEDSDIVYEKAANFTAEEVNKFYAGLTRYADGMKFDDPVLEEGRVRMAKSKQDYFNSNKTKWNQNWLTEGEVLDINSVKKAVRDLVMANMQNSDTDRKYRTELVNKMLIDMRLAYFYAKQGRTEIADALLWHSAFRMVDGVGFYEDDGNYETFKNLRDYFKDTKLRLGVKYWSDVDYAAFRKRNYGKLNLVKGETNIDKIFGDLYEEKEDGSLGGIAPEYFTPEAFEKNGHKFGSVPDTLLQIEDVLLELEPYAEAYSSEYCADWATSLASDLLDIMASGKEVQSIADKYTNKYETKIKAMKARHAEAMLRVRQQRDEGIKREKTKLKEYKEKQKERKTHRKYFERIQKNHKKLVERLTTNTADKHIPEQYKKELAKVLAAFDLQTVGSKARQARTGQVAQNTLRLNAMKDVLKKIEERTSLFHVNDSITDILDSLSNVEGMTIDELSASELHEIDKLLRALLHEFNTYESVKVGIKRQQAADIGRAQVESDLNHAEKYGAANDYQNVLGRINKLVNMDEMTPAYLFKRIDPNKEGLGLMYQEIRRSFDKYVRNTNQLNQWMEEIVGEYHDKGILWNKYGSGELTNWRSINYQQTFKLENGNVALTPAQMMSLYCLSKRPQAYGHMVGAGIVVAPVNFQAKEMSDIKPRMDTSLPVILTDADIKQIVTALTPEQIKVADKLQELMATKMAAWGNDASMRVLGIELFTEKEYFPIKSDKAALTRELNDNDFVEAIRNFGFTKAVQPGARNAIMVDDIFDVVTEHCNNMNLYNAYSESMNDFMKVYNYRHFTEDGREYTVQQSVSHAYSRNTATFIMNLMRDLNGNVSGRSSGIEDALNRYLGNAKKASVFANGRVALQQPTAIARAFNVINPIYFKGVKIEKGAMDEMFEHCPIAMWKSWGYYDINMGRSIEDVIMNNGSWLEDKATDIYGALDNVTWTAIWQMVKAEMKDTHPDVNEDTDEYWDLCNERMSEIVDLTQVVDSPLHRSDAMRNKSFEVKLFTSFMAEPTLTFNMVRDGLVDSLEAWKAGDKSKSSKTFLRTMTVFIGQAALVSASAAIWDAVRGKNPGDDDDDEDPSRFRLWWLNTIENFKDNINLLNNIYYIKEITQMLSAAFKPGEKIWEPQNLAMQGWYDTAVGLQQWMKKLNGDGKKSWWDISMKLFGGLGTLTGVPAKTLMRDGMAIYKMFGFKSAAIEKLTSEGKTDKSFSSDDVEDGSIAKKFLGIFSNTDKTSESTEASALTTENLHESIRASMTAFDEKYDKLGAKAAEKAEGLTGRQRDEALWDVIADGYTKSVDAGNLATIQRMKEEFVKQGGDAAWFEAKITDAMKSSYKKTLGEGNALRQQYMYEYLTEHGVTETEISDICYHSALAKDLKAAMRIGNEDYIMDELVPLIQAGLTREDYEKLYKYRNYGASSYSGKYTDPKYTKTTGTFIWPTDGVITSHFGYRDAPTAGASSNHPAIDIGAPMGTTVVAADGGTVIYAGTNSGYGNSVGIKHSNGMVTYYNHLSAFNVKVGDQVGQGQQIANVGSTGISTGPHLDFKILDANGTPVDPEKYLNKRQ